MNNYDKGCLMVNCQIKDWKSIVRRIPRNKIYNAKGYGYEFQPHITILYGFNDNVNGDMIKKLLGTRDMPQIEAWATGIGLFENDAFDVLKLNIVSPALEKYNKLVKKLPHENDYPIYSPHLTIAYLSSGFGKEYVCEFKSPHKIKMGGLIFSDKHGKTKELL